MKVNLSIMKRLSKYCRTSAVYVVKRSHPWYRAGITGLYVDRIAETKGLDALVVAHEREDSALRRSGEY